MTSESRPPHADLPGLAAVIRVRGIGLKGVLAISLIARVTMMVIWPDNLTDDRDGYLALATGLAEGRGFSVRGTQIPTAYRPPLYPLTLVPSASLLNGLWTATFHLLVGVATVWLTWILAATLAKPLGPSHKETCVPLLAALLVAIDPILLRYATFPMTETLATFLVTSLLVVMTIDVARSSSRGRVCRSLRVGVVFGLAALCRPTVWAFAALIGAWSFAGRMRRKREADSPSATTAEDGSTLPDPNHARSVWWITLAAAMVVVLPWAVRNTVALGRPIVMTTHGGYTLLLGNNPAFDREVVTQPWGTVWDGSHGGGQTEWVTALNREMDTAGLTTEIARDRWMYEQAWANIRGNPGAFARACWLRCRRFWGVVPVEGASDDPQWLRWAVGGFYSLVFVGGVAGLLVVLRERRLCWAPPLLMVAAFMAVHLVYWTNTRMRAPIVPVIAILSAIGWCRLRKSL